MARGHGTRQLAGTLLFFLSLPLFGATARADDPSVPRPTATPTPVPTPTPPPEIRKSESLTVSAIRAEETAPVTKTDISGSVIRKEDNGQEMPTLLSAAPSVTFYSESGGPNGYSYISIRGVQMTRLNLTFDGAPLNDPEDSTFYFANFADFAGSLGSLQIQRGVGTSTWGSASYGGSVSFESVEPSEGFGVAARLGAGSFGTERVGAEVQSGRFGPDLKLWVKASLQDTDGYRDNSGVKQGSLFWGVTREVADSAFRLSGFYGREKTQLAFLASEESALEANPRDNPMTPEENDSFWQSLVQAQFTKVLSGVSSLAVQGYFGNAGGTYRVWQDQAANQLFQYGLDWWRAGGALTYRYDGDPVNFTLGGHGSSFVSTHTGGLTDGPEEYENHGYKSEANGFAKVAWNSGPWHLLGDAQVRWAEFRYSGGAGDEAKSWVFFNPKIGARFDLSRTLSAYASVGRTSREPQRGDLLMGQDDASVLPDFDAVKPEELTDIEAGIDFRTSTITIHANVYDMEFRNEIALTGELAPTGLPISKNVPRSYRRGFEMDAKWQPLKSLRLRGDAERQPEPDQLLDAVLRPLRLRGKPHGKRQPDLLGRGAAPDARAGRQSQCRVGHPAVDHALRERALRGAELPRQHERERPRDAGFLHPRGRDPDRPRGRAPRQAEPEDPGREPPERQAALAERLLVPLRHGGRPGRPHLLRNPLLLPSRLPERDGDAGSGVLRNSGNTASRTLTIGTRPQFLGRGSRSRLVPTHPLRPEQPGGPYRVPERDRAPDERQGIRNGSGPDHDRPMVKKPQKVKHSDEKKNQAGEAEIELLTHANDSPCRLTISSSAASGASPRERAVRRMEIWRSSESNDPRASR